MNLITYNYLELSEFVSCRGIATKSHSIIMGSRLVGIAKISMIYLLYLAIKLWLTETDLKSWFQLDCHRRLHCHCQRLMALDGVIYWPMYRETGKIIFWIFGRSCARTNIEYYPTRWQKWLTKILRSLSCHWLARLNSHAKHAHVNFIIYLDKVGHLYSPPWGGTPYNGLYREAPPERGNFFRLQVYIRVI